jgi:hypothetical protein
MADKNRLSGADLADMHSLISAAPVGVYCKIRMVGPVEAVYPFILGGQKFSCLPAVHSTEN